MSLFTGTGNIRQNRANSNLGTYGLSTMQILASPGLSNYYFYKILGSGPQTNRIVNFYKNNKLPIPANLR